MKKLKDIGRKIGFTETEIKVVLFMAIFFVIGLVTANWKFLREKINYTEYDYSKEDSLFSLSDSIDLGKENKLNFKEKSVDSNQELLDFSGNNLIKSEFVLSPKSININDADAEKLTLLPGIGVKTAANILELRKRKGKFNNIEELLEVKGIGPAKFNKIKNYIFVSN